eukprot:g24266.t1
MVALWVKIISDDLHCVFWYLHYRTFQIGENQTLFTTWKIILIVITIVKIIAIVTLPDPRRKIGAPGGPAGVPHANTLHDDTNQGVGRRLSTVEACFAAFCFGNLASRACRLLGFKQVPSSELVCLLSNETVQDPNCFLSFSAWKQRIFAASCSQVNNQNIVWWRTMSREPKH